ncbi:hypothetical protein M3Y97_00208300 [Aphelenchoides bicaudatus]|nr:hypothetical protein M3Y97_00208300 [Aphelenchoides bicaudatus]
MLVASLAVPIYGLFLVTARSVDPSANQGLHSVPYLRYKTIVRAKVWQRADIAISLTMSVVCCGFAAILFFGYFKVRSATHYFLHAAISSLLLAFLYTFDALVTVCQLKSGSVDFTKDRLSRSFPTDPKHTVQADFTSSFGNKFASANNQQPIQLPNSSSAAVPTILDRLRLEIEAEHKYAAVGHLPQQQLDVSKKSWFDEERNDEMTNSTAVSASSAQQQQIERQFWEESRQINDVIVAPTKSYSKTTYSRFQQIDEPMELQPSTSHFINSSNSSGKSQNTNKRLNLSSKSSSLEQEELPSPPLNKSIQPPQRTAKPRPVVIPANQYKTSSYPYARKAINPVDQQQQIYTLIPQNRSSSNRNSETTGTSEEDINIKSHLNVHPSSSKQIHKQHVLNYPLNQVELAIDNQPRPAPLIYYKTTQAQVHPPVKARMVIIEDDIELTSQRPVLGSESRGSSNSSSATARIDEFESQRQPLSSTLVHMNASASH